MLHDTIVSDAITGVNPDLDSKPEPCDTCIKAKATRLSFLKESSQDGVVKYSDKVVADV